MFDLNYKFELIGASLLALAKAIIYYVNDLPSPFQNTLSDPIILPNGTKLNSYLYADDLIIISRSKIGLQYCLNTDYPLFSTLGC